MVPELGSIDLSDFLPHELAIDWNTGLFTPPRFSILDSFAFEDAPFPQNMPGPSLSAPSSPWLTGETFPTLYETMPPSQDGAINYDPSHKGVTGVELRVTGDQHLSTVVHAIPPLVPPLPPAPTFPLGWVEIPQRDYDHGRRQRGFRPLKPILFSTNGRPGVNLRAALRKEFTGLDGRDDPMLRDAAGAFSCRLLFPGYPDNGGSCQIHALNWTRNREPIPRSKLAHEIARKVEQYLNRMARIAPDASIEDRWRIGEGFMKLDDMLLVSLVSVSIGSFQPEIWVADHSVPHPHVGRG